MRTKQQKSRRNDAKAKVRTGPRGGQTKMSTSGGKHSTQKGSSFWNREYQQGDHFSLSEKEGAEVHKFMRWLRKTDDFRMVSDLEFMDVGCGNGRNSVYLSREFGMMGSGFDISHTAIDTARQLGRGLPVKFYVHNLAEPDLAEPDQSKDIILDFMVSHCLRDAERNNYRQELLRVLRPQGYVCIKTFLREGDEHAKRMIREHPAGEVGSYIHPMIGIYEHTWTESEFVDFWSADFIIHLLHKSHGYQRWGGQPYKRRYMVAYLERR